MPGLRPYGAGYVRPRALGSNTTVRLPPAGVADAIARASSLYGVDPDLVRAVMQTESGFHPGVVSNKGAQGLMQLMPATAARFGVNRFDPDQNVQGGVAYLAWLLRRYAGNTALAVAGYNAGENAVDRWGGVPPYAETQQYVTRVQSLYAHAAWLPSFTTRAVATTTWRLIDGSGEHAIN